MDKLEQMFKMQTALNNNVIVKKGLIHYEPNCDISCLSEEDIEAIEKVRRDWVNRFSDATIAEAVETKEAATQIPKWWKNKTKPLLGIDGVQGEIVDQFHFVMSQFLATGGTAKDLFNLYIEKNKQNFVREDWDINKLS